MIMVAAQVEVEEGGLGEVARIGRLVEGHGQHRVDLGRRRATRLPPPAGSGRCRRRRSPGRRGVGWGRCSGALAEVSTPSIRSTGAVCSGARGDGVGLDDDAGLGDVAGAARAQRGDRHPELEAGAGHEAGVERGERRRHGRVDAAEPIAEGVEGEDRRLVAGEVPADVQQRRQRADGLAEGVEAEPAVVRPAGSPSGSGARAAGRVVGQFGDGRSELDHVVDGVADRRAVQVVGPTAGGRTPRRGRSWPAGPGGPRRPADGARRGCGPGPARWR